jgi:transcriptional regulator with XRE-family HTH domain
METTNGRIAAIREHLGLNQSKFAQKLGVTSQLINQIEAGKVRLTEANIRLICFTFKVNEEWLREGMGDMMDEEAALSDYERRLLGFFRELSPSAQDMVIKHAENLLAYSKELKGEKGEDAGEARTAG